MFFAILQNNYNTIFTFQNDDEKKKAPIIDVNSQLLSFKN